MRRGSCSEERWGECRAETGDVLRTAGLGPADGASVGDEREPPAGVALHARTLGDAVLPAVVLLGDQQPFGAGEAGRQDDPQSAVRTSKLLSASNHERHDGGPELPAGCDLAQDPWVPEQGEISVGDLGHTPERTWRHFDSRQFQMFSPHEACAPEGPGPRSAPGEVALGGTGRLVQVAS